MFVIDRFEGKWAVIEYGRETFNLPRKILPPDAREGDVRRVFDKVSSAYVFEPARISEQGVFQDQG